MTSSASQGPLRLLLDAEEAEEALFLTYTANLEFFERFALGQVRSLQAATTVIADATMVTSDPFSVRGAGVRYLDERAVCPSRTAFHPKLIVLAGRDRAMVAVGSGNLTLAGWHGNQELWTVLRGDRDGGPSTLRGISRFLRQLGQGPIPLTGDATGALERVAGLLDGLPAGDIGPEVASTLDGRIVDAIPIGPVDQLMVYAVPRFRARRPDGGRRASAASPTHCVRATSDERRRQQARRMAWRAFGAPRVVQR